MLEASLDRLRLIELPCVDGAQRLPREAWRNGRFKAALNMS
jgi:hypothetical protein